MPEPARYCFTDYAEFVKTPRQLPTGVKYLCYQREMCPSTQRLHYQGYIEFTSRKAFNVVVKTLVNEFLFDAPHVEKSKGTPLQCKEYCSKSETACPGTFIELGEITPEPTPGKRTDIQHAVERAVAGDSIYDIVVDNPSNLKYMKQLRELQNMKMKKTFRDVVVHYIWGKPNCGKSHKAWEMVNDGDFYVPIVDAPGKKIWFDGYLGERTIVLDDFEINAFPREELLKLFDKYPLRLPVKGSSTIAQFTTVIITSNHPPPADPAFKRRLQVEHI